MPKPLMERRHFDLIARVLRSRIDAQRKSDGGFRRPRDVDVALAFAAALAPTNPNFNRARFLEACAVKEDA